MKKKILSFGLVFLCGFALAAVAPHVRSGTTDPWSKWIGGGSDLFFGEAAKDVAEKAAALSLTRSGTPSISTKSASVSVQVADKTCLVEMARLPAPKPDESAIQYQDVWKVTGITCK